jgi:inosose dehydratase
MTLTKNDIGVQSWSFREFSTRAELNAGIKKCGLDRVEVCGVHADFADESSFDSVISEFRSAGVAITAIGVQRFANDRDKERKYFEFAKRAGAKVITADFRPDTAVEAMKTATALSEQYGIKLGIHNHGGRHWLGNAQMLAHVFATTSPEIGLCLDTAWAMDANEDPVELVKRFGDRLYAVHIKDFVFDRARGSTDVVVGSGNLDLGKFLAALQEVKFTGSAVIEYELDENNPVPAITSCVKNLVDAAQKMKGAANAG